MCSALLCPNLLFICLRFKPIKSITFLKYKKDYNGHHPTQKPILLLEDLIKTFSNENDLVVDLTMGSGSTLVACKNTNRNKPCSGYFINGIVIVRKFNCRFG